MKRHNCLTGGLDSAHVHGDTAMAADLCHGLRAGNDQQYPDIGHFLFNYCHRQTFRHVRQVINNVVRITALRKTAELIRWLKTPRGNAIIGEILISGYKDIKNNRDR